MTGAAFRRVSGAEKCLLHWQSLALDGPSISPQVAKGCTIRLRLCFGGASTERPPAGRASNRAMLSCSELTWQFAGRSAAPAMLRGKGARGRAPSCNAHVGSPGQSGRQKMSCRAAPGGRGNPVWSLGR